jgi:sugar phosphate permease
MDERSKYPTAAPSHHFQALLSWSLVALAYCIAFMQRTSPQTILVTLQQEFNTSAQTVSLLASGYFMGYLVMQVPAGILVDILGVRKVMLTSLTISGIGTLVFSFSADISYALGGRLLVACGDALVFTALLKLVAQQFQDKYFGTMSGLSQVSGYVGGILATTPLAAAATAFGWRDCFIGLSIVIAVNWLLLLIVMPREQAPNNLARLDGFLAGTAVAFARLLQAVRSREAWGCALTSTSHFVSAASISAVWGTSMLMDLYGLSRTEASIPMLLYAVGTITGSVVIGYVADRISSLYRALIACCVARMLLLALVAPAVGRVIGINGVTVCLFALGVFGGGTQPLIFKCLKRLYTPSHIGVGSSLNGILGFAIAAALQPAIGWIIDQGKDERAGPHQWQEYFGSGYSVLVEVLIVVSFLGIVGPMMMRRRIDQGPT